jgi:hypothetical protein
MTTPIYSRLDLPLPDKLGLQDRRPLLLIHLLHLATRLHFVSLSRNEFFLLWPHGTRIITENPGKDSYNHPLLLFIP